MLPSDCQVPVKVCDQIHQGALGQTGSKGREDKKRHNLVRDAYRAVGNLGCAWKIPLRVHDFECRDGTIISTDYLPPKALVQYLVEKKPYSIFGAATADGLGKFWECYRHYHKTHEAFSVHADRLHRVIPLAMHGDEGRGKRRSQTVVVSLESIFGMVGAEARCSTCRPSYRDWSHFNQLPSDVSEQCKTFRCNLKGHSFLQHYPLFLVPGTLAQDAKPIMHDLLDLISQELTEMFHTGFEALGEQHYCALVGSKGDLKWFSKVLHLTRGYENKGRVQDKPSCHACLAGAPGLPAEDLGSRPVWLDTCYQIRPWSSRNVPSLSKIPYDESKPEHMYRHDALHTLRLGVFRDFVGSVVFLFLRMGVFGNGDVPTRLEAAQGHLKLWKATTKWSFVATEFLDVPVPVQELGQLPVGEHEGFRHVCLDPLACYLGKRSPQRQSWC